ncbi:MAG: hypothetical protein JXB30_17505 [Anaerolineae bacterium]|nr:hypothetical protein [Anaerolineae bacterium]
MGRQNIIVAEEKPPHPLIPLFGFIIFVIVGGLSYLVSPKVVHWLETTNFKLGGLVKILPIEFPAKWPPIAHNLVVTFALFFVIFATVMSVVMFMMKPPGAGDLTMETMRKEAKKRRIHK